MADLLDNMFGSDSEEEEVAVPKEDGRPQLCEIGYADVGGGRGLFAKVDIEPGSLVLSEIPIILWPDASQMDDPLFLLNEIESICSNELAVDACVFLFPQVFEEADDEEVARVKEVCTESKINEIASKMSVTPNEIIRKILAIQHNGFGTGLYKYIAMLNHSCVPNCIKYAPSNGSSWASEVWSTTFIKKGEELVMSYQQPYELIVASMQEFLKIHHRFTCVCKACAADRLNVKSKTQADEEDEKDGEGKSETQNEGASASSSVTELITIQDSLDGMEKEIKWMGVDSPEDVLRTCKKMLSLGSGMLERAAATASEGAMAHWGDDRAVSGGEGENENWRGDRSSLLVTARVHKMLVSVSALAMETHSQIEGSGKRVKTSLARRVLFAFILHASKLLALQKIYLGEKHPEIATTCLDIAEGLRCAIDLLSTKAVADSSTKGEKEYDKDQEQSNDKDKDKDKDGSDDIDIETLPLFLAAMRESGVSWASGCNSARELSKIAKQYKTEGEHVKALYSARRKFPEAFQILKKAGDCFWGRCKNTDDTETLRMARVLDAISKTENLRAPQLEGEAACTSSASKVAPVKQRYKRIVRVMK